MWLFFVVRRVDVHWPRFALNQMRMPWIRSFAVVAIGVAVIIGSLALTAGRIRSHFSSRFASLAPANSSPQLVLWAWERPTDLRFIDRQRVGVAFLARSLRLEAGKVIVKPRLQPLSLPVSPVLIAVARIETDRKKKPELSPAQVDESAREIVAMAALPNISAIQIDFDATASERPFYRALLANVRHRLPARMPLSITALASWCMDDDWIADLPIDEAVPMLFRMAADGKNIANRLDAGEDFPVSLCRRSYGISTDERRPKLLAARRLYVFNPDAWTENSVRETLESSR